MKTTSVSALKHAVLASRRSRERLLERRAPSPFLLPLHVLSLRPHGFTMSRSLHGSSTWLAYGHKTYFQPGDRPITPYTPRTSWNPIVHESLPFHESPQEAPGRRQMPIWLIVILTSIVSSITTFWNSDHIAEKLLSYLSTPDATYLTQQTLLHGQYASAQQELFNIISRVVAAAPGRDDICDAVQDAKALRERPLRLSDGRLADETNAVFVRAFDASGKNDLVILVVDAVDEGSTSSLGSANIANSWMDNSTPIQKWMLAIELDARREAIKDGDPTGDRAGMTLVYVTRNTIGIGGFGPIEVDAEGRPTMHSPHPDRPSEAMMHCVRFFHEGETLTRNPTFVSLRLLKHERAPISEFKSPTDFSGLKQVHGDQQRDGSFLFWYAKSDGSREELGRARGEVTTRMDPGNVLVFMETRRNGQVFELFKWPLTKQDDEARDEAGDPAGDEAGDNERNSSNKK